MNRIKSPHDAHNGIQYSIHLECNQVENILTIQGILLLIHRVLKEQRYKNLIQYPNHDATPNIMHSNTLHKKI